jgi:choice-of-anchor C domain-containing protein
MDTSRTWRRLVISLVTAGTVIGIGAATATPAQASILPGPGDGSFETPVVAAGTFQTFFAPATMGDWTVTSGSVDLIGAGFWQAADGNQSLDLDGNQEGGVAQTFTTVPLLEYRVTYDLAGNPAEGPTIKTGQLLANGKVIQNFSFDITGKSFTDMGYVKQEATFVATGLSSTLTFRSTTVGAFGPVIDDVDVRSCLLVICL